uniref:Uncharacterized protein n=1 Tax=Oryza glumipatula TaxID=40148 RepID=A0A0E0B0C0_9ORYZ
MEQFEQPSPSSSSSIEAKSEDVELVTVNDSFIISEYMTRTRRSAAEQAEQVLVARSSDNSDAIAKKARGGGWWVEDLWEVAEPQLSPSEKLNSCFEDIADRLLPPPPWLARLAGIHGDIYASPRDHICASLRNWALPIADPLFKTRYKASPYARTNAKSYNKDLIWWSTEGTIIQCCLQTVLFFTPGVRLEIT